MRFLPGLLEEKADPVNTDAVRRATDVGFTFGGGFPYRTNWDIKRAVTEGLERGIWVYKSIDAISTDHSRLNMMVRRGDPERGEEVEEHPLNRLMNVRPNTYEKAMAFRYRMSAILLLSKQGLFVEVVRNNAGDPVELHILPPQFVAPIPSPTRFVEGYEIWTGGREPEILEPEQVIWIKRPHPTDPYLSLIPTEAAGLSIDLDFAARMYNRSFLDNDQRPGGVLGVKGNLSPEDAEELQRRFSGGGSPGRTTVIAADDISWSDVAVTPRDAQYVQSRGITKEEILDAYGTSWVANTGVTSPDQADAAFEIYWRETMLGHLDLTASLFDQLTSDDPDDDDLFAGYDLSQVSVLQRDKRRLEETNINRFKGGMITLNDTLEPEEAIDHPAARVHWIPPGNVPVGDEEDVKKSLELVAKLQPQAAPPNALVGSEPSTEVAPPRLEALRAVEAGEAGAERKSLPEGRLARVAARYYGATVPEGKLDPVVTVIQPPAPPRSRRVERDEEGNIMRIVEE